MYIHSISVLIIAFSFIFPILLSTNLILSSIFWLLAISLYFLLGGNLKRFLLISLLLLPLALSIFFLNLFFPGASLRVGDTTKFLGFVIYEKAFQKGIFLFVRIYMLSSISISYAMIIDFVELIYGLMQSFRLPPKFGFPIFIAINSVHKLKDDFIKIKTIGKIRKLDLSEKIRVVLTMIINVIRYADRSSLSLISRKFTAGERSFYLDYKFSFANLGVVIFAIFFNVTLFFVLMHLLGSEIKTYLW